MVAAKLAFISFFLLVFDSFESRSSKFYLAPISDDDFLCKDEDF
jgi:hypothetical protein